MAQQIYEGTWEEIVSHSSELAGRRVRLMILDQSPEQSEKSEHYSLADALSGKLGILDGASPDLSSLCSFVAFAHALYVLKKQKN